MPATTSETTERAAETAIREASAEAEIPSEVDPSPDRTREIRFTSFTRMRTDWSGEDGAQVALLRNIIDGRLLHLFPGCYQLMNELYDIVREPVCDAQGVVQTDAHGFAIWARSETGAYIEDYSQLTGRQREDFLFRITTNIFEWKQLAADLWGEAMFAKVEWEEVMANGFLESSVGKNTDEARTQRGRLASTDHRYFAIFQSLLSRKADAMVNSLELLGQRLKDVLT